MAISSCDLFMVNIQLFKETKYTLRPLIDMQAFLEIVSIFFWKKSINDKSFDHF